MNCHFHRIRMMKHDETCNLAFRTFETTQNYLSLWPWGPGPITTKQDKNGANIWQNVQGKPKWYFFLQFVAFFWAVSIQLGLNNFWTKHDKTKHPPALARGSASGQRGREAERQRGREAERQRGSEQQQQQQQQRQRQRPTTNNK